MLAACIRSLVHPSPLRMVRLLRRTFVQLPRAAISGRVDAGTVFRKHFADTPALVAVSSPDVGQPVALYPAGRGSAQSLRNMSLNSRRWRYPSAKSNQLVARMLHELSTGLHEPVLQTHQRPALDPLRVLAPFAVDQAADLCSCGHENDDSAAGLVCMSWTATGTRTTATWNA